MKIGFTGRRSSITEAFVKNAGSAEIVYGKAMELPLDLDQYLLCAGVLAGKSIGEISDQEAEEMFHVNFLDAARFCDRLFESNDRARVCIIGSYSGYAGSYDAAYAGTKAALHLYIETKRLRTPGQHLVGVAPTIIEDTGMTSRRSDIEETLERGGRRRLGRWLRAEEVARAASFALAEDAFCNTVLRMTGGNW